MALRSRVLLMVSGKLISGSYVFSYLMSILFHRNLMYASMLHRLGNSAATASPFGSASGSVPSFIWMLNCSLYILKSHLNVVVSTCPLAGLMRALPLMSCGFLIFGLNDSSAQLPSIFSLYR